MGQDAYPWTNLKRPLWQCLNPFDAANSILSRNPGVHLQAERWMFGAHMNPLKRQAAAGAISSSLGTPRLVPQMCSSFSRPMITPTGVQSNGGKLHERKFLIFDQSGSHTTMIFSSVSPALQLNGGTSEMNQSSAPRTEALLSDFAGRTNDVINQSDETTYVSQGSKRGEVSEETDDIDALLYSEEEEGNATPCSPDKVSLVPSVPVEEDVASSGGPLKRRKLDGKMDDETLRDTASSATMTTTTCYAEHAVANTNAEDNDQSSCVKGSNSCSKWSGADHERNHHQTKACGGIWKMKRDHIRETVNVLRGIIPGCKGKDAGLVLDEAIRYLKSLELKVQALGGSL